MKFTIFVIYGFKCIINPLQKFFMRNYLREAPIKLVFRILMSVLVFDLFYLALAVIENFLLDLSSPRFYFFSYSTIIHGLLVIIQMFFVLYCFIKWHTSYFLIEDSYITSMSGLIIKNKKLINYANIRSVNYEQGIFGRIFNYGDIAFELIGTGKNLVIRNIDNPGELVSKIEKFTGREDKNLK